LITVSNNGGINATNALSTGAPSDSCNVGVCKLYDRSDNLQIAADDIIQSVTATLDVIVSSTVPTLVAANVSFAVPASTGFDEPEGMVFIEPEVLPHAEYFAYITSRA